MNAQEYRSAIAALGLTQGQCAQLLGIDVKTVWRYCNGDPIPKVVELAVKGLIYKRLMQQLEDNVALHSNPPSYTPAEE